MWSGFCTKRKSYAFQLFSVNSIVHLYAVVSHKSLISIVIALYLKFSPNEILFGISYVTIQCSFFLLNSNCTVHGIAAYLKFSRKMKIFETEGVRYDKGGSTEIRLRKTGFLVENKIHYNRHQENGIWVFMITSLKK